MTNWVHPWVGGSLFPAALTFSVNSEVLNVQSAYPALTILDLFITISQKRVIQNCQEK